MSFPGKKLINDPNSIVPEFIQGLVETYPHLQYLDGFPEVKVVLHADVSKYTHDRVAVISGGGSGHEPAHAGFVGEGMLMAAICGDIFTSPPVNAILSGIRAVTGPKGCLLIVKNYTGDRLNFGLAAEQAKSEGYNVETVIVGDDCALPLPRGITGRRGLAGTILVHKVAGAAAAAGLSLSDVAAEAQRVSGLTATMGMATSVCTLPGQGPSDRLGPGKIELGLGIHGEPGVAVVDMQPLDVLVSQILQQIITAVYSVSFTWGSRVALLINGLGATTMMELMMASGKATSKMQLDYGLVVDRVYVGSFMTSLDMGGFSISLMKVDEENLERLDAPTTAPYWPVGIQADRPTVKVPFPATSFSTNSKNESLGRPSQLTKQGRTLEVTIEAAANAMIVSRDILNKWDGIVGDGDCGSTMFRGATAILEDMRWCYPLNDVVETVNEIGLTISRVMGGTSGIIYEILCKAAYTKLKSADHPIASKQWSDALEASIAAVSKYGGASAGYRTLLDSLIPASRVLKERLEAGVDPSVAFVFSSDAALAGAESTKEMKAQAGRSTYVPDDIVRTVPDPGAMAAAYWYRAAALALKDFGKKSSTSQQ